MYFEIKNKHLKAKFLSRLANKQNKNRQTDIFEVIMALISVMWVGSDTFGDPIFQKGLQN